MMQISFSLVTFVAIFGRISSQLTEEALTVNDTAGELFGYSVAMWGNRAIIGSKDDDDEDSPGSAYIFELSGSTWSQTARLVANDGADGDEFGYSVSIYNDYAIVGAFSEAAVYFYELNSSGIWEQVDKVSDSSRDRYDHFGCSISIYDDYALIGAQRYECDACGSWAGGVYVYHRESDGSWTREDILYPSDTEAGDHFGSAVSVSGTYAIIGMLLCCFLFFNRFKLIVTMFNKHKLGLVSCVSFGWVESKNLLITTRTTILILIICVCRALNATDLAPLLLSIKFSKVRSKSNNIFLPTPCSSLLVNTNS